jgi:hypothetical protein
MTTNQLKRSAMRLDRISDERRIKLRMKKNSGGIKSNDKFNRLLIYSE